MRYAPIIVCAILVTSMVGFFAYHTAYASREKALVIIVPSYNNEQWYKWNLDSIFAQEYSNYKVIYIDDCSGDNTYANVVAYSAMHRRQGQMTIIKNEQRAGALANLYYAIHQCPDNAIIITLDGDDALKHNQVFKLIDRMYDNPDVWMTFGQYEVYPEGYLGICHAIPKQIIEHNKYREYEWVSSHLRTFKAGLFKKIKREDLLFEGDFFDVAWDQAFMFPLLEMAGDHARFIPDIMYVYNQANPLNDFKINFYRQQCCSYEIRKRTKYQPLDDSDNTMWYS